MVGSGGAVVAAAAIAPVLLLLSLLLLQLLLLLHGQSLKSLGQNDVRSGSLRSLHLSVILTVLISGLAFHLIFLRFGPFSCSLSVVL